MAINAFLINANSKEISQITLTGSTDELVALINVPAKDVGFDEIDDNGDRLYFDEACFINEKPGAGRFRLDTLPPVSGMGIVVGWNTADDQMSNAKVMSDTLKSRVSFL